MEPKQITIELITLHGIIIQLREILGQFMTHRHNYATCQGKLSKRGQPVQWVGSCPDGGFMNGLPSEALYQQF